jgi:hypothetical protein
MSVERLEATERVREILHCASHGIEADLMGIALEADMKRIPEGNDGERRAILERLHQDLLQLPNAARLRFRTATLPTDDAREAVPETRRWTQALVTTLRGRAERWRELACDEESAPTLVDLRRRVDELAELLRTEASVRDLSMTVVAPETFLVRGDPGRISREIFRGFVLAIADARRGDRLVASLVGGDDEVLLHFAPSGAVIRFSLSSAEGA